MTNAGSAVIARIQNAVCLRRKKSHVVRAASRSGISIPPSTCPKARPELGGPRAAKLITSVTPTQTRLARRHRPNDVVPLVRFGYDAGGCGNCPGAG